MRLWRAAHEQSNTEQNNAEQSRNRMRRAGARPRHGPRLRPRRPGEQWSASSPATYLPGSALIVAGERQLSCIYAIGERQAREAYEGTVSTLGLDIGATSGGQLTWAVFAPTNTAPGGVGRKPMAVGPPAARSAAGASANVLVGGSDRTVVLQPVSRASAEGRQHCGGRIQNRSAADHCAARRTAQ